LNNTDGLNIKIRRKLNFVISCFAGAEKLLKLPTGAENPARLFMKKNQKIQKKRKK
jgi:hypothetical protein